MFFRIMYSYILVYLLYLGFLVNSIFNKKIRQALVDRSGLWQRYSLIPAKKNKKRIWFHVSSAGELEQAKPVIRLFEEKDKDVEIVLTYFSPSAKRPASNITGTIFCDYLPLDTISNARKSVEQIDPDLVVFVKFDIWPNIVWEAKKHGARTALIDGTLHRSSKRYSNLLGQSFYNSVYGAIDLIGVVSESDLNRFMITAPKHKNIKIVGDTRFDQVAFRAGNAIRSKKIPERIIELYRNEFTLILGSTWEADDRNVLDAVEDMLDRNKKARVIIVPHEPEQKRVNNYLERFSRFKPLKLSEMKASDVDTRLMVVDEVGVLAELYMSGTAAYIGGAFSTGVHNVMEPSIMGLPVCFGPFYFNAPEAEDLVRINCAYSGNNPEEFTEIFNRFAADIQKTKMMGLAASEYIKKSLGSDKKYYDELKVLLGP